MSTVAPIIEEAWQHRRRRHRALGITALATLTAAAIVIATVEHGPPSGSSVPAPTVVAASAVLSRPPYMGVRCPGALANSIACDRVGLAVWLKRPAVSVTATIAGAPLVLNHRDEFLWPGDRPHTSFDGFLKPAGITSRLHVHVLPVDGTEIKRLRRQGIPVGPQTWLGEGKAGGPVRLTIHEPGGRTIITHVYVGLRPGWG
ncbi:MAG TPA: hypothetical protein VHU61_18735 [Solirubrobacteraceae bacterium]|jgi:hypothetical protein|nr:hypothetical protein [Solirubrobacteraceae bacterium]